LLCQVREYDLDPVKLSTEEESGAKVRGDLEEKKKELEQFSQTAYGEVHAAPMPFPHL
jgi:hypothetical protein